MLLHAQSKDGLQLATRYCNSDRQPRKGCDTLSLISFLQRASYPLDNNSRK
jgi:hypothetical protein